MSHDDCARHAATLSTPPDAPEPKPTAEGLAALRAIPVDVALVQEFREGGESAVAEPLRAACEEFRDSVLHSRHQLAELADVDPDVTNAVLGLFDNTIGAELERRPTPPATGDDAERLIALAEAPGSAKPMRDALEFAEAVRPLALAVARQSIADREALVENREMVKTLLLLSQEQKAEIEQLRQAVEFMRAERGG